MLERKSSDQKFNCTDDKAQHDIKEASKFHEAIKNLNINSIFWKLTTVVVFHSCYPALGKQVRLQHAL